MIEKVFGALECLAPGLDIQEAWSIKEKRPYIIALVAGVAVGALVSEKLLVKAISEDADPDAPRTGTIGDEDDTSY